MNRILIVIILLTISILCFTSGEKVYIPSHTVDKEHFIDNCIKTHNDTYKKYFVLPFESDDYDTPLLDNNKKTDIIKFDNTFIEQDTV